MSTFSLRTPLPVSAENAFAWYSRPGAFERLVPPWQYARVVERQGGIRDGDRLVLELGKGPLRVRWTAVHRDYSDGRQFRDVQTSGPFARWIHTHRFLPAGPEACLLEDEVEYELPLGALGRVLGGSLARRQLERMFRMRHARTRGDLERHRKTARRKALRVVLTGASGLVGTSLAAFLTTGGHRVDRLVQRPTAGDTREIPWDPAGGVLEATALEGADAVVHLAGESVAGARWSRDRKRAIRESRVNGTALVARTLAGLRHPPRVLISASAIGICGNRPGEMVTEESPPGTGFLAEVARDWEAAAEPARRAGVRVVHPRFGIILSARGGTLASLLIPFRLGLGGVVGDGRQTVSWIALDDAVGAIHHLIVDETSAGPVNVVAPNPVTSREFTATLARVLGRPALLPLPASMVHLLFGEMGQALLLDSAHVRPAKLEAAGFQFHQPMLEHALRAELGRWQGVPA